MVGFFDTPVLPRGPVRICLFLISYLGLVQLYAQEKGAEPFHLKLVNTLKGELSDRQGSGSSLPRNFLRDDLLLTLEFYGMPIEGRAFLSTEKDGQGNPIRRFSLSLHPERYAPRLRQLAPAWVHKALGGFSTIEIGTCSPSYSPLLMTGLSLQGVNLEYNPGYFYAALVSGTRKATSPLLNPAPSSMQEKILFGRLGFGKKKESHIYFSFLRGTADPGPVSPDTLPYFTKKENYAGGAEMKFSLFKNKVLLESEAAGSYFTRNTKSPALSAIFPESKEVEALGIKPTLSTTVDYSLRTRASFQGRNTSASAELTRIGPGYQTMGIPYLRNDILGWQGSLMQYFDKRRVSVRVTWAASQDNLLDQKRYATRRTTWSFMAMVRYPKAPYLMVLYTPTLQEAGPDSGHIGNEGRQYSLSSGYNYLLGKTRATSTFTLIHMDMENRIAGHTNTYASSSAFLSQSLKLTLPIEMNLSAGYSRTAFPGIERNTTTLNLKGSYGKAGSWRNSAGIGYSVHSSGQSILRLILSTTLPVGKFHVLMVEANRNFFRDDKRDSNDFDETVIRATFITRLQ